MDDSHNQDEESCQFVVGSMRLNLTIVRVPIQCDRQRSNGHWFFSILKVDLDPCVVEGFHLPICIEHGWGGTLYVV